MKLSKQHISIDAVAEPSDEIHVRFEQNATGFVLYVDVNGITVFRLGHLKFDQIHIAEKGVKK